MAIKKKPKYRYDRIQFIYRQEDVSIMDKLCEKFGGIDRQALLRIALKRLATSEKISA